MAKWQDKTEKRIIKEEKESRDGRKILSELFSRYKVNFTKKFKITNWTKEEQWQFERGMKKLGYEGLIRKYK